MSDFYRELAAMLRENGCKVVRQGKGSHEIWYSPINGRHFTVARSTKSRHTANETLKQAGLPKAFQVSMPVTALLFSFKGRLNCIPWWVASLRGPSRWAW